MHLEPHINPEVVQAVNEDGTYRIKGRNITTTGTVGNIRAGQVVDVGWKEGRPQKILAHNARRVQFAPVGVPPSAALIEELFIVGTGSTTDIYFRNFDAAKPLQLSRFISVVTINIVKWGLLNDRFLVQATGFVYHIFKLRRTANTPLAAGTDPATLVSLEQTITLASTTMAIATLAAPNQIGPSSFTLTPAVPNKTGWGFGIGGGGTWAAGLSIMDTFVDDAGAFIVAYHLTIGGLARSIADPFGGARVLVPCNLRYPIVADLTNSVILLDGFSAGTGTFFNPLPAASIIYNTFDFTNFLGTWTILYSGPDGTVVCFAPSVPELTEYLLGPMWCTSGSVPTTRVRGYVGIAHTLSGVYQATYAYSGPPLQCSGAAGEFSGVLLVAPVTRFRTVIVPFAAGNPGISAAATTRHLLWRKTGSTSLSVHELNTGGADSPGFATVMETGVTTSVSPALRATFGFQGLQVLATDFIWRPDSTSDATFFPLPAGTKVNFFVDAWKFAGAVTLNTDDPAFPKAITAMTSLTQMAALPAGVVLPSSVDFEAFYVNNDRTSLSAIGAFKEWPP